MNSIWIGWDPREQDAFEVARRSLLRHLSQTIPTHALKLGFLQSEGLYTRPTERIGGKLIDKLSMRADYDGAIATEHANARFFVPMLAKTGWALFVDGDVLFRADAAELFALADPTKAVMCVKHNHDPVKKVKMDGQAQTRYSRKNWSSVMAFNCDHPANRERLTLELLNTAPGRDLHAFCWLRDEEIGDLDPRWNHLVNEVPHDPDAYVAHFTCGTPDMEGYEAQPFANEWRAELARQAA